MPKSKKKESKPEASSESQVEVDLKKKKKQNKKGDVERLNSYLKKILKEINTETGIDKKATNIVNGMVVSFVNDISTRASELTTRSNRNTINAKAIKSAIRLVIPNVELATRIIKSSQAAADTYTASIQNE